MKRLLMIVPLLLLQFVPAHAAGESDLEDLSLYYRDEDLVVTALRSPRPASSVAENLTVITAEDIVAMNAHTLLDVLRNVPGVQVDVRGGPGSLGLVLIQGADFRQVRVVMDGVPLNNMLESASDLSLIPLQVIERVEIIKGPASSTWGSGHGGVINIVTKTASIGGAAGGALQGSGGERGTADLRAEGFGSIAGTGVYLSGEALLSDGFHANNHTNRSTGYGKFSWSSGKGAGSLSAGRFAVSRGDGGIPDFGLTFDDDSSILLAALNYEYSVSEDLQWVLNLRHRRQASLMLQRVGGAVNRSHSRELLLGASALLNWKKGSHHLTAGIDFDQTDIDHNFALPVPVLPSVTRTGVFLSDSIVHERFSVTPSVRYDISRDQQGTFSASLGATWNVWSETILRASVGSGYTIPIALRDVKATKAVSSQIAVETSDIPWVKVKGTLFLNDMSDALRITDEGVPVFDGHELRKGGELEVVTDPVWNTSLSAGFALVLIDQTAQRDRNLNTIDLGLHYKGEKTSSSLLGHYIWWDEPAEDPFRGDYSAFVWDLNVSHALHRTSRSRSELFFAAHNLFNASQYAIGLFHNPRRWIEGGVRINF